MLFQLSEQVCFDHHLTSMIARITGEDLMPLYQLTTLESYLTDWHLAQVNQLENQATARHRPEHVHNPRYSSKENALLLCDHSSGLHRYPERS